VQVASLRDDGVVLFVCLFVCLFCLFVCSCVALNATRRRVLIVSILDCYCACCDYCSPAMSVTLCWLLQCTVHSQQQECTPDSQECTVESKASESWQIFPVNNVSKFRLSRENALELSKYMHDRKCQCSIQRILLRYRSIITMALSFIVSHITGNTCNITRVGIRRPRPRPRQTCNITRNTCNITGNTCNITRVRVRVRIRRPDPLPRPPNTQSLC